MKLKQIRYCRRKNNDFEETVQDEAQRATTKIQQKK